MKKLNLYQITINASSFEWIAHYTIADAVVESQNNGLLCEQEDYNAMISITVKRLPLEESRNISVIHDDYSDKENEELNLYDVFKDTKVYSIICSSEY